MIDELNDLLQPMDLKWREPELRAIVEDYILRRDINAWYWNENGRIYINHDKGVIGSLVSFNGYCLENGDIRLVPQINYEALTAAIWELKLWRNALLPPTKQDDIPELPERPADRAKWVALWRLIQEWVVKGDAASEIQVRIELMGNLAGTPFEGLPVREGTIRKVIAAGRAGLFDSLT